MPRKINYGVDYDEDYDDYEEYDYEYDDEDTGKAPQPQQEVSRPGIWRCAICTYDNEEDMSACDICGVIRNPTAGNHNKADKRTADSVCKDSGVSMMAKSLFGLLPHQTPHKPVVAQLQEDEFVANREKGASNFLKSPFKFDIPSPDDLVSNGLHSSKKGSRANAVNHKSPRASSGISDKNGATNAQSTIKRSDSSSLLIQKGEQGSVDEGRYAPTRVAYTESWSESSDNSSALVPKSGSNRMDESICSKSGTLYIQSSDETLESSSSLMPESKNISMDDGSSSIIEGEPHRLTSNLNNMSLSDKSGNLASVNDRKSKPIAQYEPDKWMVPDKADNSLTQLNLAIVGHVDSGKSTLSGRLLHLLGRITQKEMHKFERDAKLHGKGSFAYAWPLDESSEERERGITMTVAVAYFDTKRYHVVLLDSPGHKDFVPNMISGATQADAAILVIDSCFGAFEAGMDSKKGQTREHAQLIRSFGVDQIIVGINKMDAVDYSKDRFDFIKTQLRTFLRSCGFKDSLISWIPFSAMENQNLVSAPSDVNLSSWYCGPCLLDAIDSFQPPSRDFSKPLLMPVCDVIKVTSSGQVSVCGKLEAGALRSGSKVLVMPSGEVGTVRTLERDSCACSLARAGDNVVVTLMGIDGSKVMAGGVLCHPDFPVAVAKHLELKVLVLDFATPILNGSQLEFHIQHTKEAARVVRIVSLLDPKTGKVAKQTPRHVSSKQHAVVEVMLQGPVCVQEFSSCKALGRVSLRVLGRTIALGVVTRIIEEQD